MARTNFDQLLQAGSHFGHLKRKWNPHMAPYIFTEKKGIHIIDLHKTVALVDEASAAAKQIAKSGKRILYVATKKQAKDIVQDAAQSVNMPSATERCSGGMLTNFATIRKAMGAARESLEGMEKSPEFKSFGLAQMRHTMKTGKVGKVISGAAYANKADLLVLGTVARSGVRGRIIGNSAERILTRAPCDVLCVTPDA